MPKPSKRLYSIRLSNDWVELRSSFKPLNGTKTKFSKMGLDTHFDFWTDKATKVPRPITFQIVHWTGGRVITVISAAQAEKINLKIGRVGVCKRVPETLAKYLLNPKTRKALLET